MEKKLYDLTISETLEKVMPPLRDDEIEHLTQELKKEGCRDSLVVWDGVIVDGHNRYRICHEHGIPFDYVERSFESEEAAKLWIIRNQLGRRNLSDFVRCEMVLQYEEQLKAEAKKRQGQRNDLKDIVPKKEQCKKPARTLHKLAELAGVSHGTLDKAKKLINGADEETKKQLRAGEVKIGTAFNRMNDEGQKNSSNPKKTAEHSTDTATDVNSLPQGELLPNSGQEKHPVKPRAAQNTSSGNAEILPGMNVSRVLGSLADVKYRCPSDLVYSLEPISVYGATPADNPETRGAAEFAYACGELRSGADYFIRKAKHVMASITAASRSEENLQALRLIVDKCYGQVMELLTL